MRVSERSQQAVYYLYIRNGGDLPLLAFILLSQVCQDFSPALQDFGFREADQYL